MLKLSARDITQNLGFLDHRLVLTCDTELEQLKRSRSMRNSYYVLLIVIRLHCTVSHLRLVKLSP